MCVIRNIKKTQHITHHHAAASEKNIQKMKAIPMGQHFAKCAVWWQNELGGHSAPYRPQLYSKPVFLSTTGKSPKQGFISERRGKKMCNVISI